MNPVDCPSCHTGIIRPHEIAQQHDRCADCRTKAFKAKQEAEITNNIHNANRRIR